MKLKITVLLILTFLFFNLYSQETEIKVVSWNIQLLPNGLAPFSKSLRKMQKKRLPWIIEHCNDSDYDIIVFQEVFDIELKRRLRKGLIKVYPYQIKTKSKFGRLTSNGILIVSKTPIKYVDHVIYKKGVREDGWAAKGCTMIEGKIEGVTFQIAGTHLQSGKSEKAIMHRDSQYGEIKDLIDKNKKRNIPILIIGDLNTEKSDSIKYNLMLQTLNAIDYPINDKNPYTYDDKNSWINNKGKGQIDYILLIPNTTQSIIKEQKILRQQKIINNEIIDFSDHYGVVSKIKISNK